MIVDSHCHLDQLETDLPSALTAAIEADVAHILCVCIDMNNVAAVKNIADQYEGISASVGLHPNEAVEQEPTTEELIALADNPFVVAIGETGLDYYRTEADTQWQQDRFARHIHASQETQKPLIIHTRQARKDTIAIMKAENAREAGGVMHCFTESLEMAKQALDLGFYISFSGIITFKNAAELREVVKAVPLESILIETDAPYLAPVPYRGKSNQPAYVRYVAEMVAELKGISYQAVAEQTTKNFFDCFPLAKNQPQLSGAKR